MKKKKKKKKRGKKRQEKREEIGSGSRCEKIQGHPPLAAQLRLGMAQTYLYAHSIPAPA